MDEEIARRLGEDERYQFLDNTTGKVELRTEQIRNYMALRDYEVSPRVWTGTFSIFIDGKLKGRATDSESLYWLAERALNKKSVVLIALEGAGKRVNLFMGDEDNNE